jgi:hypothetical protein
MSACHDSTGQARPIGGSKGTVVAIAHTHNQQMLPWAFWLACSRMTLHS